MSQDSRPSDIQIIVKVFGGLRDAFKGGTRTQLLQAGTTLGLLLEALKADFPELSRKLRDGIEAGYLNILINGRNVLFLQGQDTILLDGDTVAFLPPVGGG